MKAQSIRTFIGAKDYEVARQFYRELGFTEFVTGPKMSLFRVSDGLSFYLQDYYAKEWIENSMVLLEVEDVEETLRELQALGLPGKYSGVKLSDVQRNDWGSEVFLHDPSGVLWHFAEFVS